MSYADLDALKAYLRIDGADEVDDVELQSALDTATSEIDQFCSRTFNTAGEAPDDPGSFYGVPVWDRQAGAYVLSIPDLATNDFTMYLWNDTDLDWTTEVDGSTFGGNPLRPLNTAGKPYTAIVLGSDSGYAGSSYPASDSGTVLVRAYFGWPGEPPAAVRQACLIQAARIWRRRDALFGIVNSPDGSGQTRLREALDSDVAVALRGYVRYWVVR